MTPEKNKRVSRRRRSDEAQDSTVARRRRIVLNLAVIADRSEPNRLLASTINVRKRKRRFTFL